VRVFVCDTAHMGVVAMPTGISITCEARRVIARILVNDCMLRQEAGGGDCGGGVVLMQWCGCGGLVDCGTM
jgi:hypothetical protein